MKFQKSCPLVLIGLSLAFCGAPAFAVGSVFNLSSGFSATANPNPPWSYGWVETNGGAFTPLQAPHISSDDNGLPIPSWQLTGSEAPAVYRNTSTNTVSVGGGLVLLPPDSVWFLPGENGRPENFGVIRFTVPPGGSATYIVSVSVDPFYSGPPQGDTDFHVLRNGAELFGEFLSPEGSAGYTNSFDLASGDTIDFVIGRGADGNPFGSALRIVGSLTTDIEVPEGPTITAHPQSQAVTFGSNATFSVVAEGTAPLNYQWRHGDADLPGATNATLLLENVQLGDAGAYTVVVSNFVNAVQSSAAVLTVFVPPPPGSYDANRDFSLASNPNGAWSYGALPQIGGAFTPLAATHIQPAANGVEVQSWELQLYSEPAVFCNTSAQTATSGENGTYPPGIIWFFAGYPGSGHNLGAIRFTLPAGEDGAYRVETAVQHYLDGAPAGDTDFHVVKNGAELFGQFLSPTDRAGYTNTLLLVGGDTIDFLVGRGADDSLYGSGLKIAARIMRTDATNIGPLILVQPQTQSAVAGSSVTFSVVAEGTPPLSYQWLSNGVEVPGATSASLTLNNVQSANSGKYSVRVSNPVGSVLSAEAMLNVITLPPPGTHDLSRDFAASENPGGDWSFGWSDSVGGVFNLLTVPHTSWAGSTPIPSWQLTSYQTPAVYKNTSADTISIADGQGTFPPGTVWYLPGEDGRPENFGVIRFTVPTNGAGNYHLETSVRSVYEGSLSRDTDFHVVKNRSEIFGEALPANSATGYTNVLALAPGDTIDFAIGRGADGSQYASGLKIHVALNLDGTVTDLPPLIVTQPQSQTVLAGVNVIFGVDAEGTAPLAYQWRFNGMDMPGKTSPTLILTNVQALDAGKYSVQVSNIAGVVLSLEADLKITTPLSPGNYDLSRDFSAAENPSGVWSFGWAATVGGAFTLLTVPHISSADGVLIPSWQLTSYQSPSIYQNTSTNTVSTAGGQGIFPPGTVWYNPGEDGRPENFGVIRFTVPAGAAGNYRLEAAVRSVYEGFLSRDTDFHVAKNGMEIFGEFLAANSGTSYSNALALSVGDTVDFVIGRGADGSQYASGLKIQASLHLDDAVTNLPPLIVNQPQSQTVLAGSAVNFGVVAEGTAPLTYQWRFNGTDLPGQTAASLALNNVQAADAGAYSVRVSNPVGSTLSAAATLTVSPTNAPPVITQQPSGRLAAPGETVLFSVQLTGTSPLSYQWRFNEGDIAGANGSQLLLANVQPTNAGIYSVVISNPFGTATSDAAQLTVTNITVGGSVNFANKSVDLDSPIFDVDGITRLAGPNFRAQLYAGPTIATIVPVGPSVGFNSGGYFYGGTRNIPTVVPGQIAYVQVRAWDQLSGTNYDIALSAGGKTGLSTIFSVTTGNGGSPPALPTTLYGLQSFSLTLGAAASPLIAPVLRPGALLLDGTPTWLLTGQIGATYSIECSTNLQTWTPLFNVFNPGGTVEFTDPNIGTTTCSYYRARLVE